VQNADLRGGEPDSQRVVHQQAHAPDLVTQRIVKALDRTRLGLEHRVAEFANVGKRCVAPSNHLGIQLGLRGLRWIAVVLRLHLGVIARGQLLFVLNLIDCFAHTLSLFAAPLCRPARQGPPESSKAFKRRGSGSVS
jgi:hypothetical protein